jgi:arylsulfatase A-like enzyme
MIARWPGRVEAGSVSEHVSAFWDVMPTLAEATGQPVPENLDGISFLPALLGQDSQSEHEYLYWEYHSLGGMQAVRMGNWKGVRIGLHRNASQPIQLYDLGVDVAESNDVAAEHPDIVARIKSYMESRTESTIPEWNFAVRN